MTKEEAIQILDPETGRAALLPYAYDPEYRLKRVTEACMVAVEALKESQSGEKRGDYINRETLLDAIYPVDPENDGSDRCTIVCQFLTMTSADMEALICDIPAADVAPVVRGKWVDDNPNCLPKCSVCGHRIHSALWDEENLYCGYCGAKMDENVKNE